MDKKRPFSRTLCLFLSTAFWLPVSAAAAEPASDSSEPSPPPTNDISALLGMQPGAEPEAAPGPQFKAGSSPFGSTNTFVLTDFSDYLEAARANREVPTVEGKMPAVAGPIVSSRGIDSLKAVLLKDPLARLPKATQPVSPPEYRIKMAKALRPQESLRRNPSEVAAWWNSLTPDERRALIERDPKLIGGMSGIPNDVRDAANRKALEREIQLTGAEVARLQKEVDFLRAEARKVRSRSVGVSAQVAQADAKVLEATLQLKAVRRRYDGATALQKQLDGILLDERHKLRRSDVFLLDYDSSFGSGEGRAIISLGDPSKAQNIGVEVPGIMNRLNNVGGLLKNAANLRTTIRNEMGPDALAQSATIVWLGYDTPDGLVRSPAPYMARTGAASLRDFVGDLRTNHLGPNPPKITVFGHSYGSAVTGLAGSLGMDADEVVLLGSPGAGVMRASEMYTRSGRVWAARTDNDPIKIGTHVAALGGDPMRPQFGAKIVPLDSKDKQSGHSGYYELDSLGLLNFARIMSGRNGEVDSRKGTN